MVSLDAPGHGDAADVRADLWTAADLVAGAGGPATYVGYSMGARICLHAALAHPETVARLVLVSGTAGIEDNAARSARRAADDELAASIERDGVDAFLERWLSQPLFASLPPDARQLDDRRRNTSVGLASSLRLAGTGTQQPLWDRLAELAMPVLLVAGALDTKFVALAERMQAVIPDAELAVVPATGHTVHLERPNAFAALLTAWLTRTDAT